jgi:hypothetical protein
MLLYNFGLDLAQTAVGVIRPEIASSLLICKKNFKRFHIYVHQKKLQE